MLEPTVQPWCKREGARNAPILSLRRRMVEHGWLSWHAKSAAGGLANRFLHLVAEAKVRDEPEEFRDVVKRAWMKRCVFAVGVHGSKSSCPFLVGAKMRSCLRWRGAIHFRSGP